MKVGSGSEAGGGMGGSLSASTVSLMNAGEVDDEESG